ncbi:hypothetical protein E2Q88_26965 [Escherichia coli]|nr:hypothetical protein [Escherichia coli]
MGEEAEERRNGHVLLTPRCRVFSLPHEALFNQSAPMQHIKPVYTPLALRELVQGCAPKPPNFVCALFYPVLKFHPVIFFGDLLCFTILFHFLLLSAVVFVD